jgi:hypothetical protein
VGFFNPSGAFSMVFFFNPRAGFLLRGGAARFLFLFNPKLGLRLVISMHLHMDRKGGGGVSQSKQVDFHLHGRRGVHPHASKLA